MKTKDGLLAEILESESFFILTMEEKIGFNNLCQGKITHLTKFISSMQRMAGLSEHPALFCILTMEAKTGKRKAAR